ncbi:MAG: hypothetical protein BIFFINMI_02320 [Phycisphaerae bacterium]|nr:hypothetical protein [Phycisphaerae bacterium]
MSNTSQTNEQAIPREKRFFTLAEANRALPLVSRIVADIQRAYRDAKAVRARAESHVAENRTQAAQEEEVRLDRVMDELNRYVEELAEVGAQLKDWDMGLIDFPAIHQGREVLLCWHPGEAAIAFWHDVNAGFAGRQAADLLDDRARGR